MAHSMNPRETTDLQILVIETLLEHYQAHVPKFLTIIKTLVDKGKQPDQVERIIQSMCPPGSGVGLHAHLLASYYSTTQN